MVGYFVTRGEGQARGGDVVRLCSVLQRMLRRNPLAALAMYQNALPRSSLTGDHHPHQVALCVQSPPWQPMAHPVPPMPALLWSLLALLIEDFSIFYACS